MMDALPLHDARRAGLKKGIVLGEKRGLLAGEQKKAIETAKKMFEENIPAETIAECTGLPLEKVNKLNQNNS